MNLLSFAKGALAMFWLVALLNLLYPFGAPVQQPLLWLSGGMLLVHLGEVLLFDRRLRATSQPWLARIQVLLFGLLHLRGLR